MTRSVEADSDGRVADPSKTEVAPSFKGSRFEFVSKHFPLISSSFGLLAASVTCIGLYSYLSVFDSNAIHVIEYSDIAKVWVLLVSLLPIVMYTIVWVMDEVKTVVLRNENWQIQFKLSAAIISLLFSADVLADQRSSNPFWEYHLYKWTTLLTVFVFVADLMHKGKDLKLDVFKFVSIAWEVTVIVGFAGHWSGVYVRDFTAADHQIQSKAKVYPNARLVLLLSHHVIFQSEGNTLILPATEIIGIVKASKSPAAGQTSEKTPVDQDKLAAPVE